MITKKIILFIVLILAVFSSVLADSRMVLTPEEIAFAQSLFKASNKEDTSPKILALLNDKPLVMSALSQNGLSIKYVHPELRDDIDVMMRAVSKDGLALAFSSERLKDNVGIVCASVRNNPDALKYASRRLQDDKTIALMAVGNTGKRYRGNKSFRYLSTRLKNDKSVVLRAIRHGAVLSFVNDTLKNDPQIIQAILKVKSRELQLAGDQIRNDKHFILEEVKKLPRNCDYIMDLASDQLKADRDFVLKVFQVEGCTRAFSILPEKLRKDKALAKVAIRQDGYHLYLFDLSLRDDWSIIKLAPKDSRFRYHNFSQRLRKDKKVFKKVLAIQESSVYPYADASIQNDKALTLMALKIHGYDLRYANARLRKDYQVVKTAVSNAPDVLKYAHKNLQNTKEIVMLSVRGDPSAFEYASPALKKDKDVLVEVAKKMPKYLAFAKAASPIKQEVLTSVEKDGNALEYASDKFKKDKEIVWAAVRQNGHAIQYVDKKLQNNQELKLLAIKTSPDVLYFVFSRNKFIHVDKEMVIATMKQSASNFRDLDKRFRADKAVVLAAISAKSASLEELRKNTYIDDDVINALIDRSLKESFGFRTFLHYLSKPISNKTRLLKIIRKDGLALEYASTELKRDRAVVLTAINQNGNAVAFADNQFKHDKTIAKMAITTSGEAFDYLAPSLQLDRDLLLLAIKKGNKNILRQLYCLLERHDSALAGLIINPHKSLGQTYKRNKVALDLRKIPKFYLPDHKTREDPKFVLSNDKTRIAGIVDLRPQGVSYVAIWNTKTGRLLSSTRLPYSVLGFGDVSFTPDNKRLVAASGGFIWNFSKHKRPVMCYLDTTIMDINNNAVLMYPNDWVNGIYDLDNCEPIVLANQMNTPQTVIGPRNKLLMLSFSDLSKKDKDILLYQRKPEHLEHSKNFRHRVDLWEIPVAKDALSASMSTLHNVVEKYLVTMRYDRQNTLTVSKWDYMKKHLVWTKAIKNMSPLFNKELYKYQADFAYERLYLADKKSVRVVNLKSGHIRKFAKKYKEIVRDSVGISSFKKKVIDQLELHGIFTEDVGLSQNNGSYYVRDHIFDIEDEEVSRVNLLDDANISLWTMKK